MGKSQQTVTFRVRSLGWFSAGLAVALATTGILIGVGANAAPEPGSESAFVPIEPCRLADTRPELDVNVGDRNTPIGKEETHEQQVTGEVGNCDIPDYAVAVALNVTAIAPTEPSFMTLSPFGTALPMVSNLNYLPGAPPTPNKVDVKLSSDGKVAVYNLDGTVHFIADVAGYYTSLDDRTTTRSITMPAQALNMDPTSTYVAPIAVDPNLDGVRFAYHANAKAHIQVRQPADWTGVGDVVVKLMMARVGSSPGVVQFVVHPRSYNAGDPTASPSPIPSNLQTEPGFEFREITMTIPAASLSGAWWDLMIQRNVSSDTTDAGDVIVYSVEVTYEAKN